MIVTLPWRIHTRSVWLSSAALVALGTDKVNLWETLITSSASVCVIKKFLFEGTLTRPPKLCTQWLISLFHWGFRVCRYTVSLAARTSSNGAYWLWKGVGLFPPCSSEVSRQVLSVKQCVRLVKMLTLCGFALRDSGISSASIACGNIFTLNDIGSLSNTDEVNLKQWVAALIRAWSANFFLLTLFRRCLRL